MYGMHPNSENFWCVQKQMPRTWCPRNSGLRDFSPFIFFCPIETGYHPFWTHSRTKKYLLYWYVMDSFPSPQLAMNSSLPHACHAAVFQKVLKYFTVFRIWLFHRHTINHMNFAVYSLQGFVIILRPMWVREYFPIWNTACSLTHLEGCLCNGQYYQLVCITLHLKTGLPDMVAWTSHKSSVFTVALVPWERVHKSPIKTNHQVFLWE